MSVPPANAIPSGRLRIGQCVADAALCEIGALYARRALRLAPKSLAVLLTPIQQPGHVVTRAQLLAEGWPDILPTNDVVTQVVTQLRKALASSDGPRSEHIETIAKTRYRLMAPVKWETQLETLTPIAQGASQSGPPNQLQPDNGALRASRKVSTATPTAHGAPKQPARPSPAASTSLRQRRWMALAVYSVALLVVLGLAARSLCLRGPSTDATASSALLGSPKRQYQVITAGGGFDLTPSLSPDVGESEPASVRLIEGLRADARQAADWSADSQRVLVSGSDADGHAALFEAPPSTGKAASTGKAVRLPVPQPRPSQATHLLDPSGRRNLLVGCVTCYPATPVPCMTASCAVVMGSVWMWRNSPRSTVSAWIRTTARGM
ncbi:regulatory protein [Xanthomonas fragariae]|nr:regulatory protein [Xanthomonas fragariae]